MNNYQIPDLFALGEIESKAVLKACSAAHQALGELKGVVHTMPNQNILLGTLPLQEAKESSEIENIITTQDDLYQSNICTHQFTTVAAKEVHYYAQAMSLGFDSVRSDKLITLNLIKEIQAALEGNNAGFRKQQGTGLVNQTTKEIVYMPPQNPADIEKYMSDLERFINDSAQLDYDPLVKMALIHHQFESIHPFYDGNGRTGRIINVLYLVLTGLLDIPVLYLSRYPVRNKSEYYRLLQHVRDTGEWEGWLLYMLEAVEQTAKDGIDTVQHIHQAMLDYKHRIRQNFSFYSQDLINHLFNHPYTKIDFLMKTLNVSRPSAAKYLDELTEGGFLHKEKIGRSNYYINIALMNILLPTD